MKTALFAAALVVGIAGTANAQQDPNAPMVPPGDGITQQGTNPEGQPCTPPGFNQGTTGYPQCGAVARPTHGPQEAPPCTRQVTDHCTQTYERGVRPN